MTLPALSRRCTLGVLLAVLGVSSALAQDNAVKVGLLLPLTGPFASTGKQLEAGARLQYDGLTESIRLAIDATFSEDAIVLQTQQRQLDIHGGHVPRTAIKLDEAPGRARRLLEALVRREDREPDFVFEPPLMVDDGA